MWKVAVAYWRDGGLYPRARSKGDDDPYLRAIAVMVASLRRFAPDATVELHTNLAADDRDVSEIADLGVSFVPTPFEHRMPEGYFHKFSASTYSLDVVAALGSGNADQVALLVDPDVFWLREPTPIVAQADAEGIVTYPIPMPADFQYLGYDRAALTDLTVAMTGRPAPDGGLVVHLGGELLGGTTGELARFSAECSGLWEKSLARFHAGDRPWLHTEEHVFTAAFHALGYDESHTTEAMRRVCTRPGRLRNVRDDDLDRVAWHALSEKGLGLDRLFRDLTTGTGAFEPGISDAEFRRRAAQRLRIYPSPWDRVGFFANDVYARLRGKRRIPMPA